MTLKSKAEAQTAAEQARIKRQNEGRGAFSMAPAVRLRARMCDGSMADLLCEGRRRGGGMSDASIIGTLAAWQWRYCPFFFAGSVRVAAEFTERFLRGQIAEAQRTAKAVAKMEVATP